MKIIKHSIFLIFLLFINYNLLTAQIDNKGYFNSQFIDSGYEIHRLEFVGNSTFDEDILIKKIKTRPTYIGLVHGLMLMYYNEGKSNRATPKKVISLLEKNIEWFENERRTFSDEKVNADVNSLELFYQKNGFHEVTVSYEFYPDSTTHENVVIFYISEGARYTIDEIRYNGLENISQFLKERIDNSIDDHTGEFFNEEYIEEDINTITEILENNGYYDLKKSQDSVIWDTETKTDVVIVNFDTGIRKKIGNVKFNDIRNEQPAVSTNLKYEQLDFKEGDLYSKRDALQSRVNLLSLGVFENANINFNTSEENDSLLDVTINLIYSTQQEWEFSPFINRTVFNETINSGIEAAYTHKNIGGKAQKFRLYGKAFIRDISRHLGFSTTSGSLENLLEVEYQAGIKFDQPSLFSPWNWKINLSANPNYSIRNVLNLFTLRTVSLPITFHFRLPYYTVINNIFFDINLESEKPSGLDNILVQDSLTSSAAQSLIIYSSLDDYDPFLTLATMGFRLIGDKRNNPLNPTSGYYFNSQLEVPIPGANVLSNYTKVQTKIYGYLGLNDDLISAGKINVGHIFLNRDARYYIPLDRQYFAGGASSVRGWGSRELRYNPTHRDSIDNNELYDFLRNFVGSTSLIELSAELRYKFSRPEYFSEFWADQIASLGMVGFVDFGNSYDWLINSDRSDVKVSNFFNSLAVSVGVGIRYDTPVGPLRLDMATPIKDPDNVYEPFNHYQFHIGLGHAF